MGDSFKAISSVKKLYRMLIDVCGRFKWWKSLFDQLSQFSAHSWTLTQVLELLNLVYRIALKKIDFLGIYIFFFSFQITANKLHSSSPRMHLDYWGRRKSISKLKVSFTLKFIWNTSCLLDFFHHIYRIYRSNKF